MLQIIKSQIAAKRVLVLGYGREGRSSFALLKRIGGYASLDIADRNFGDFVQTDEHHLWSGDGYLNALDDYDLVFKSPGIVLPKKPSDYRCLITSQTDIFLSCYGSQTVGITGTKGKSTVTTLLHHVLTNAGVDCALGGNIGIPVFDLYDQISHKSVIILELSCHQLEFCRHSPATAVLLNLYEDHLDHYGSFDGYIAAKSNVYAHQRSSDVLYCHPDFVPSKCPSRVEVVDVQSLPFNSLDDVGDRLRGAHNVLNCAFVHRICKQFGIDGQQFTDLVRSYSPLAHRLEFIGNSGGVDYYDDSISTTVESAMSAVVSVDNAQILLLGGMDRGIDYAALVDFLPRSRLSHVIFMYESGRRMHDMLMVKPVGTLGVSLVDTLRDAVELAQKLARPGGAVVLSPASASYGDFKNFEERGEVFKRLIFG